MATLSIERTVPSALTKSGKSRRTAVPAVTGVAVSAVPLFAGGVRPLSCRIPRPTRPRMTSPPKMMTMRRRELKPGKIPMEDTNQYCKSLRVPMFREHRSCCGMTPEIAFHRARSPDVLTQLRLGTRSGLQRWGSVSNRWLYPPVTFSSRKSGCCKRVNSTANPSSMWRTTRPCTLPSVTSAPIGGR